MDTAGKTTKMRCCAFAVAVTTLAQLVTWSSATDGGNGVGGFVAVLNEVERCAANAADPWPCLRHGGRRLVTAAVEYPGEISLVGQYLTVVPTARHEGRRAGAVNGTLSSMYSRFTEFADDRMLRVSLPLNAVARLLLNGGGASDGSRGKKDKGAGVLMLGGMMMITTLMATAFGSLALMAAKGLLTSILALMLSAMAVAKKSGHGHARTTYEVINAPPTLHHYQDAVTSYKLENGVAAGTAAVSDVSIVVENVYHV